MRYLKVLPVIALMLFTGCGGGGSEEQAGQQEQQMEAADDIRTIDIVGINSMKFAVESATEGLTVGNSAAGAEDLVLLESITAAPGETIRIRLTTRSTMDPTVMSHNWVLLEMGADAQAFANASATATDNEYIDPSMSDQIIAQTGMAGGDETVTVTFTVPEQTGEYDYLCTFPAHFAAGMKGILIVEEPGM